MIKSLPFCPNTHLVHKRAWPSAVFGWGWVQQTSRRNPVGKEKRDTSYPTIPQENITKFFPKVATVCLKLAPSYFAHLVATNWSLFMAAKTRAVRVQKPACPLPPRKTKGGSQDQTHKITKQHVLVCSSRTFGAYRESEDANHRTTQQRRLNLDYCPFSHLWAPQIKVNQLVCCLLSRWTRSKSGFESCQIRTWFIWDPFFG